MSYTVLARKYRSRTFDEIVGQEPIATTLKNAVSTGRVHHGYLFCGTRGVGKTSMARILAKALNCLKADAPTPTPCGKCELCLAVAEGNDIDVVEIDAASNTGVDNIRELRSNTVYRPARARFKVYIIDEVHMLSQGAFNALLKTLEEPPDHVKFIFATTEPQRVLPTIQSRCQRFDFRSISVDKIAGQLEMILKAEKIKVDDAVIRRVARLANGSMRDALSLLDQLLSLGSDKLSVDLVDQILPAPHDELLAELVDCLAANDPAGALDALARCLNEGHSLERICGALIDYFRQLMVIAVCGPQTELLDVSDPVRERLAGQAARFDAAAYTYMIAVAEELRRSVRFSGSGRALTEAAIVRLASMERFTAIETLLARLEDPASATQPPDRGATEKKTGQVERDPSGRGTGARRRGGQGAVDEATSAPSDGGRATRPRSAGGAGQERPPAQPLPQPIVRNRVASVTGDERREALAEPVVKKTLELFDGELANVEKEPPQVPGEPADEADSSD